MILYLYIKITVKLYTFMNKYELLAQELHKQIADGQFQANMKLPSVRQLCKRHDLSMSTVVKSLEILQQDGVIESRDRSGFYINPNQSSKTPEPQGHYVLQKPTQIDNKDLVLGLVRSFYQPNVFNIGPAIPSTSFLPVAEIDKSARQVMRMSRYKRDRYETMPGCRDLLNQISIYMRNINCEVEPDNIVITNGCQEANMLALMSFLKEGDTVAVETPTYPGFIQLCELLKLEVIEIPTDPRKGISIGALELAAQQWPIDCLLISSNYSNPMASRISTEKKQTLIKLCERLNITIVEDDVYGDLSHDPYYRPRPLKSFDQNDTVIYCNSFSKTISPGLRVGWVINKKHHKTLEYNKYISGLSTVTTSQYTIAEYLKTGKHQRYLQSVRRRYAIQVQQMMEKLHHMLPEGTLITQPRGGFVLWLALPEGIESLKLLENALTRGVAFSPGILFSASDKYLNCLRINCSMQVTDQVDNALKVIAEEAHKLLSC